MDTVDTANKFINVYRRFLRVQICIHTRDQTHKWTHSMTS